MTVERAFLLAVPLVGVLLAGGYFVSASNFGGPGRDVLAELPEPDSWQVSGEEVTDMVRASVVANGGTVEEFKAPEPQTTAAVPEPSAPEPAAAPQRPAASPKKVARQAPAHQTIEKPAAAPQPRTATARPLNPPGTDPRPAPQRQRNAAIVEPPRVSQLPPPPAAEPEAPPQRPVARREERGLLGRSWDTVARTTGTVTEAVVSAPSQAWRATRKTVDVVVDTTVDTAKIIIPGSRRSSDN